MTAAVGELLEADPDDAGKRRIRPELWPDPGFVDVGVRGDAQRARRRSTVADPLDHAGGWRDIKFVDAVAGRHGPPHGARTPASSCIGEDVHRLNGGTNGATKGLAKKYGDNRRRRVLGTPISENAFSGLGGGLALDGRFRPVVEFMYPGLHVGRRRPGVQPDRQGAPHVRRRQPGAARAAHQGRDGLGLRLAAPDGSRRASSRPAPAGASSPRRPPPTTSA